MNLGLGNLVRDCYQGLLMPLRQHFLQNPSAETQLRYHKHLCPQDSHGIFGDLNWTLLRNDRASCCLSSSLSPQRYYCIHVLKVNNLDLSRVLPWALSRNTQGIMMGKFQQYGQGSIIYQLLVRYDLTHPFLFRNDDPTDLLDHFPGRRLVEYPEDPL